MASHFQVDVFVAGQDGEGITDSSLSPVWAESSWNPAADRYTVPVPFMNEPDSGQKMRPNR